ncbi:hemagglutinin repeat-containing protein [Rahnella sp. CG8]|uniref:hemagglutinin repeat-containing protein n=1 Tax=Rahnella sp. CG8 TaxID=2726078 RepID=UPI00203392AB
MSASVGTQSSKSESHSGQNTATGSTLTAGDNLSITATGGDITTIGSQIKAGLDVALNAADDINLISSQNTQWLEGENSSSGGAIGIGIGMGESGAGINISASGNASRGSESGNGTQHNETTIDAGNRISINSGDDTTIAGAQVSGNSVMADIGGAVLASTSSADKNSLNTGTLGFSDIGNKAADTDPKAGQPPCFGSTTLLQNRLAFFRQIHLTQVMRYRVVGVGSDDFCTRHGGFQTWQ